VINASHVVQHTYLSLSLLFFLTVDCRRDMLCARPLEFRDYLLLDLEATNNSDADRDSAMALLVETL